MKVKIYGLGWVGKAMQTLFPQAMIQDPSLGLFAPEKADVAFVCVPTPSKDDWSLDTSIVEEVVKNAEEPLIVIRSTVNPGDCDRWIEKYKKRIVFQAEFLGETPNHPLIDETQRKFL